MIETVTWKAENVKINLRGTRANFILTLSEGVTTVQNKDSWPASFIHPDPWPRWRPVPSISKSTEEVPVRVLTNQICAGPAQISVSKVVTDSCCSNLYLDVRELLSDQQTNNFLRCCMLPCHSVFVEHVWLMYIVHRQFPGSRHHMHLNNLWLLRLCHSKPALRIPLHWCTSVRRRKKWSIPKSEIGEPPLPISRCRLCEILEKKFFTFRKKLVPADPS